MIALCGPAAMAAEAPAAASSAAVRQDSSFAAPTPQQLAAGAKVAQSCAACHGIDGNATSDQFPKLAAQHADYIVKQLRDYQAPNTGGKPRRENPIMNGIAAALSPEQIRDVALYFSRQPLKPAFSPEGGKTLVLGRSIWMGGIRDRRVPACAACHGPGGAGIPSRYPRVGGQWDSYLTTQLQLFRNDQRTNSPEMHDIASRMTDGQIQAVADYTAGLRAPSEQPRVGGD